VRRSQAYYSTKVTSPDTVFRRLTNTVDVHLAYISGGLFPCDVTAGGGGTRATDSLCRGEVHPEA